MRKNKVQNSKTPLSQKSFNDNDILCAALSTEKYLCNSYTIAMHEVSNDKLYLQLFSMLKETSQLQRKLFDLQFLHGWLSLTPASQQDISAITQEFNETKKEIQ